jgi:endonuclease-3 related protein
VKEKVNKAFELLFDKYGEQFWWPGETPWEVCAGAVLTQNTNWGNVEKAIELLKQRNALDPEVVLSMPDSELEAAIRPSGFFRLKAKRLRAVARWWLEHSPNIMTRRHEAQEFGKWRESLLSVNGVGEETADSILLYAFDLPVFVIDAYTRRMAARHFQLPENISYGELQHIFMDFLPKDVRLYNEYHALIVRNSKDHCRKKECTCDCPLRLL